MKRMKLSEIKIKPSFVATTPSNGKMNRCREYWWINHAPDRDIIVDNNNVLVDGYIQYLVLKENGVDEADVKLSEIKHHEHIHIPNYRNKTTTYIYGIHPNSTMSKAYVWRVPNSWVGWEKDLLPGDRILVRTKFGLAPIIITKIDWLDQCPVDVPVRKVVRKLVN